MNLSGAQKQLEVGINVDTFVVLRPKQFVPVLEINIQQLNYKVSGISLVIQTNRREYKFQGNNLSMLERKIEMYKTYWR